MAAIVVIGIFFVGVLGAALSRQCGDEFKAWVPWIIKLLLQRAIARLPQGQRERYAEEWRSHLDQIPGEIGKLIVAIGLLSAARKMSPLLTSRRGVNGVVKIEQYDFGNGDRLRVVEGPFRGFEAIFERYLSGAGRIAIILNEIDAQRLRVVLPASAVMRCGGK
jgi:hypothetical protein